MKDSKKDHYFIHESSFVDEDCHIGEGTKIWHFSHISSEAKIGKSVSIGQNVFVADGSGKVVSLKVESGERNWIAPFGSSGNLWVAGKSLFFISNTNHLVRLKIKTGDAVWMTELPSFSKKRFGYTLSLLLYRTRFAIALSLLE